MSILKQARPAPNKALKHERVTYDSFYQDGVMTIDKDVVKHKKTVFLTVLQAKALNNQSANSGVEYQEVVEEVEEAPKKIGRPKKEETN